MKERFKGIITGLIIGVMITTSVIASTGKVQKILHYNNVKITLNGNSVTPKDANGNIVEPFIIDGTTYLPVRAVSDALGLYVDWDGATNTVKLSETPFESSTAAKTEIEKFVEEYGDDFKTEFDSSLTAGGLTCTTTVSGKGNEIIVETRIDQLEDLSEEEKAMLQSQYDSGKEPMKAGFEEFKDALPSLEKITFYVCEKDGDVAATIELEF